MSHKFLEQLSGKLQPCYHPSLGYHRVDLEQGPFSCPAPLRLLLHHAFFPFDQVSCFNILLRVETIYYV